MVSWREPNEMFLALNTWLTEALKERLELINRSKWKNERPSNNRAYEPTLKEHFANIITHGIAVVPSFYMSLTMIRSASGPTQYRAALIYGAVLTGLFTVSTIFHTVACFLRHSSLRDIFHRGDRAMIYVFIAGSYTPWLTLRELEGVSSELRWAVWVLTSLGVLYQQVFHERYKTLETFFYVVIALMPALSVFAMQDVSGLEELQLGGLIYMIGVVFFKCDGVIPMAHAIWHLHVVAGALIHFNAVNKYLMTPDDGPATT